MKIIDKLINFFRHKSPTLQEMIDASIPRYKMKQKGNILNSPFVSKIIKPIYHFCHHNYKWILNITIPTILTIIGLYIAYLALISPKP